MPDLVDIDQMTILCPRCNNTSTVSKALSIDECCPVHHQSRDYYGCDGGGCGNTQTHSIHVQCSFCRYDQFIEQ